MTKDSTCKSNNMQPTEINMNTQNNYLHQKFLLVVALIAANVRDSFSMFEKQYFQT